MNRDGSTIAASRRTEFRSTSPNPLAATNRGRGAGCHGNFPPGFQLGGEIFLLTFPSIEHLRAVRSDLKPDTVVRWHRRAFARYWTWKSRRCPGDLMAEGNDLSLLGGTGAEM